MDFHSQLIGAGCFTINYKLAKLFRFSWGLLNVDVL